MKVMNKNGSLYIIMNLKSLSKIFEIKSETYCQTKWQVLQFQEENITYPAYRISSVQINEVTYICHVKLTLHSNTSHQTNILFFFNFSNTLSKWLEPKLTNIILWQPADTRHIYIYISNIWVVMLPFCYRWCWCCSFSCFFYWLCIVFHYNLKGNENSF